ncbi:MAG: hypothetical protein KGN79_07425 [Acidobacteriota bacterium]|nr:hypothetical protein [Acidobacteriota bacterium]
MNARVIAWLPLLFGLACAAQETEHEVVLPQGTMIKLVMAETLNSKHAFKGQRVELQVAEDVLVGDALVIPKKTRVLGTVNVGLDKEGKRGNAHAVVVQVDYVRMGERKIELIGAAADKGKVDAGNVVAGAVFLGLSGALIAVNSRTGEIKEGTEVPAFVAEDVSLPVVAPVPVEKKEERKDPETEKSPDSLVSLYRGAGSFESASA